MDTDALEALLERLERSGELDRLQADLHGRLLPEPDRPDAVAAAPPAAARAGPPLQPPHRIFILEDAAYRELRFDGPDLPSIKSFDARNEHVILAMTFSKPCAPGLKTGYGLLPRDLVAPLLRLKGNHDFGSNNLTQHLLDRLLATGPTTATSPSCATSTAPSATPCWRRWRRSSGDWPEVRWTRPGGGLYVWLTFPPEIDTGPDESADAGGLDEGVLYVPGQFCHVTARAAGADARGAVELRRRPAGAVGEGIQLAHRR